MVDGSTIQGYTLNFQWLTSTLALLWTSKCDQQLDSFHNDKYHTSVWFLFLGLHYKWRFPLLAPHFFQWRILQHLSDFWDNLLFTVIKNLHWGNTIWLTFWPSVKIYMVCFMFLNRWIVNCLDKFWVILSLFNQIRMGTLKANSKFSSHYTQVLPTLCLFILWK